jgi:uncharacterized protein (DUF4213/DUF364 family)
MKKPILHDTLEAIGDILGPELDRIIVDRVTVVGPTVGLLPGALLRRGADILGSVRITEPDAFLDVLAEGGGAPDFLGRSAQKVVLVRRRVEAAKVA